jgi:hypothetical protein
MRFWEIAYAPPGEGAPGDLSDDGSGAAVVDPVLDLVVDPVVDPPVSVVPATVPLDVFQKRVAALTRQKAELEARLASQPPQLLPSTPVGQATDGDIERMVATRAAEIRLNEKSEAIANAGQAIASDFLIKVRTINSTLGTISPTFIEALDEAGGSPEVSAQILYDH